MAKLHRVGIFGGTFDPVHQGHEHLARQAADHGQLDVVIWLPTRAPSHKKQIVASYEDRCAMVETAIATTPHFKLMRLPPTPTSYGIDLWQTVHQHYPHSQYYWLLGWDSFASLPYWYQRQALIPKVTWLVAPRCDPPSPSSSQVFEQLHQQNLKLRWQFLPITPQTLSATAIRQAYQAQRNPQGVSTAVKAYIRDRGLYQP